MSFNYLDFTARNWGYIDPVTQDKIKNATVLIAGCGIGSQVAECASRIGFQKFILVDGDTIDIHNLNRQFFFQDQIGKLKVEALRENILRINPEAQVTTRPELLTQKNAKDLVQQATIIFDTIDFLDLEAILALHDEAHRQKRLLVSSFSIGFGAAVINFIPNDRPHSWLREIFDLPLKGPIGLVSYVERYQKLFTALAPALDPMVLEVMSKVFKEMSDGKICPAPQVAPGAHEVASMCITAAVSVLQSREITKGPRMVVSNLFQVLQGPGFLLAGTPSN